MKMPSMAGVQQHEAGGDLAPERDDHHNDEADQPGRDQRREVERVRHEHPSQGGGNDQHAHGDRGLGDDVVKGHPAFERLHRRLRGAGVLGVAGWRLP